MNTLFAASKTRLGVPLAMVAAMWVVEVANLITRDSLEGLGIRPRTFEGLWGILFTPFLHANFAHLVANTAPFLILGWLVAVRGRRDFILVTASVVLIGGAAVWLLGRPFSNHIGASGLVFGYLGFLLARGVFERSLQAILLSLTALLLYGGLLWGVLPSSGRVSWESHLFGGLAGLGSARLFFSARAPSSPTESI